jgi:rare lipoprotein A (peptidoglycan hydrolase)
MVMEVTDQGPHLGNRGLNLSRAAQEIGLTAAGTDEADMRVLAAYEGYGRASREERDAGDALDSATVLFESPTSKFWARLSRRTRGRPLRPARRPR